MALKHGGIFFRSSLGLLGDFSDVHPKLPPGINSMKVMTLCVLVSLNFPLGNGEIHESMNLKVVKTS